jgi:hypothetical protein
LKGDSAVWLLVAPEEQLKDLSQQLQAKLDAATPALTLPQGIGLPGSELYSEIPLEIRFSVLPVSNSDAKEQTFLKMIGSAAEEWRTDTAYLIPVFGRCRALEVFPYADANEALIEDVGNFLCAACSCRVKQANPGFDLLASVNWNERLFGESIPEELRESAKATDAVAGKNREANSPTNFLAIPAGNQPIDAADLTTAAEPAERLNVAARNVANQSMESSGPVPIDPAVVRLPPTWNTALLLLAAFAMVSGGILAGVFYLRRQPA